LTAGVPRANLRALASQSIVRAQPITVMSDPVTPPAAPAPAGVTEDRTVAILTYITIIGFIIAIVLHSSKKTALGTFHLRQGLGLIITAIVLSIGGAILAFIPFVGWLIAFAGWILIVAMWLMGLIAAASGQQKPTPVLGEYYQKWFAGAFG
jgi:uncharacterized membrane protein